MVRRRGFRSAPLTGAALFGAGVSNHFPGSVVYFNNSDGPTFDPGLLADLAEMLLDYDSPIVGRGASARRHQLADALKHGQWQGDLEHMSLAFGDGGWWWLWGPWALLSRDEAGLLCRTNAGRSWSGRGWLVMSSRGRAGAAGNDAGKALARRMQEGEDSRMPSPDVDRRPRDVDPIRM